ncbi:MAG: beta family protein [Flavobacteriales bacterium]
MKKYYPILVSKKGEIVALQHLEQSVKDEVSPIIEVIESSFVKVLKNNEFEYKDDLIKFFKTHWTFFGNQVVMDFSLLKKWDLHGAKVKQIIISMIKSGVNVVMAIQRNSSKIYCDIVKELINEYSCKVCIRTSVFKDGFFEYNKDLKRFASEYKIKPDNTILLLDLEDLDHDNYKSLTDKAISTIRLLDNPISEWADVIVSSSSFPENLSGFNVSPPEQRIKRYEWKIWELINSLNDLNGIKYGDYGVKSAAFVEANFAGTISLKYSSLNEYIIYRGVLTTDHKLGHRQFIRHCQDLVENKDYSGKDFSWGDLRYFEISVQDYEDIQSKTGNTTNWVQFSQNHHITLMHSIL